MPAAAILTRTSVGPSGGSRQSCCSSSGAPSFVHTAAVARPRGRPRHSALPRATRPTTRIARKPSETNSDRMLRGASPPRRVSWKLRGGQAWRTSAALSCRVEGRVHGFLCAALLQLSARRNIFTYSPQCQVATTSTRRRRPTWWRGTRGACTRGSRPRRRRRSGRGRARVERATWVRAMLPADVRACVAGLQAVAHDRSRPAYYVVHARTHAHAHAPSRRDD